MFDSFRPATASAVEVSGIVGRGWHSVWMKIIILCVILKYGDDNFLSPAKAFQNNNLNPLDNGMEKKY